MNLPGLLAALLGLVAFGVSYHRTLPFRASKRALLLLLAVLISIPGLSFPFYYTHLLPESALYYQFRSLPGAELFLVPIGIAGGLAATFLPRFLLGFPLFGAVGAFTLPFLKPIFAPIRDEDFTHRSREGVVLQSTPSTCGPAATTTLMRSVGIEVSEMEIARAAHSSASGTEAWYLARAARARGARVEFAFFDPPGPGDRFPAMLGTFIGGTGHFIVILGEKDGIYSLADPLRGLDEVTLETLNHRYRFSGFRMLLHGPVSSPENREN
ncbi:MAG: hypothetical protein RLZ97_888 [Verrucomicrobiota bacterium]|jgi:hypothetical protein